MSCSIDPDRLNHTQYTIQELDQLAKTCNVPLKKGDGRFKKKTELFQDIVEATLTGLPKSKDFDEISKEFHKEEPVKKSPCNLKKKCPQGYRRAELVEIAQLCGVDIKRESPGKGSKNMKELCDDIEKTLGKLPEKDQELDFKKDKDLDFKKDLKFPETMKGFIERAEKLFQKYDYNYYPSSFWYFFNKNRETAEPNEDYSNQWKVFYNPKREYFFPVLETILKSLKDDQTVGKIVINPFKKRKEHRPSVIDSPHDPKIVLYYLRNTSREAQKDLKNQTESVLKNIPENLKDISLPCDFLFIDGNKTMQCGPSFTKKLNDLVFYTQGGYSESSRARLINQAKYSNKKVETLLRKEYEGENFYKFKGDTDPFGNP